MDMKNVLNGKTWSWLFGSAAVAIVLATIAGRAGALSWCLDLFAHFHVQYVVGGVVFAALSAVLRYRKLFFIHLVLIALNGAIIVVDYDLKADLRAPEHGTRLLFWNVFHKNDRIADGVDFIRRTSADVVILAEPTEAWRRSLDALNAEYPYRLDNPACDDHGCSMVMMSRLPWREVRTEKFVADTPPVIWAHFGATLATPAFNVVALHVRKAIDPDGGRRQQVQIAAVGKLIRTLNGPVVIGGDMNATPTSAVYDRLLAATGLHARANNLNATWPAFLGPFGIAIDHVLVSDGMMLRTEYGPPNGSDHRPLIATVGFAATK